MNATYTDTTLIFLILIVLLLGLFRVNHLLRSILAKLKP